MSFNVTLQPSGHTFEADPARNILRSGLEAGFNLPYSCRASGCATCKARIVSGTIDHGASSESYMPQSMRAEGYALLCQANPPKLWIDVDGVWNQPVFRRRLPVAKEIVADDAIVVIRDVCERRPSFDIAQSVDVGEVRLQPVVYRNETAGVYVYASGGEVELFAIRHSTGGDQEMGTGDGPLSCRAE